MIIGQPSPVRKVSGMFPEFREVVIITVLFGALGAGYLIGKSSAKTEIREVVSIVETEGKIENLQHGGYGHYDPLWKSVYTNHGTIDEVKVTLEKKNAQRFIDDRPERVELVELFYRKVN